MRGASFEKLFQELGLQPLKLRLWLRKLCLFYKVFHRKLPGYLFQVISLNNNVYATRWSQSNKISSFNIRHDFSKDFLFPAVIKEQNIFYINIQNSFSINIFKNELLKFIRTESNFTYYIHDTKRLKLLIECSSVSII